MKIVGWQRRRRPDYQIAMLPPTASKWVFSLHPTERDAQFASIVYPRTEPTAVRPVYIEDHEEI